MNALRRSICSFLSVQFSAGRRRRSGQSPGLGAAIAVEAETRLPVARRLAEAVGQFEKLFKPRGLSPAQFVRQMQFRRRLSAQLSSIRARTLSKPPAAS